MTRSTNMEHVEVLRVLRDRWAGPDERVALDAAIAALSAPQPPAEAQPVAWMRRCAFDRVDVLTLAKSDRPRGWNMHAVTENKALPDDVPLYAHPPPSAPVGVEVASLPALWRQREDNGEERTEFDKGYEQASDECAEALERALARQPAAVAPVGVADAWQEGYRQGVLDERTSEDNIGI